MPHENKLPLTGNKKILTDFIKGHKKVNAIKFVKRTY